MPLKSLLLAGIVLLSLSALRAEDAEGGPRTLKIGPSTQIQLDGNDATAAQLKSGFEANVTEDTLQAGFAATIDAHTPSAKGGEPAKPAKAPAGAAAPKKTDKAPAPASGPKHWIVTAVGADSITVEYK